jgi:hypothetical protein
MSQEIHAEYATLAQKRETRAALPASAPGSTQEAYYKHLENIKKHLAITDPSRVDSMIALRLRATGHSQEAVRDVIRTEAPAWRGTDAKRDWERYASRTTDYAFGVPGDRDLQRHEKYTGQWLKLEGRDVQRPTEQKSQRQR